MSFLSSVGGFVSNLFNSALDNLLGGVSVSGNLTVHPDYCVHVHSSRSSGVISIMAPLPETFSTNTSSDYDTPFADGLAAILSKIPLNPLSQEATSMGLRLMGASTSTQAMTMQVWQGSAPMEFSIPMHFVLNTDAETDVIGPVRQLMSLTLPSSRSFRNLQDLVNLDLSTGGTGGFLISPGPKFRLKNGATPADLANRITGGASDALSNVSQDPVGSVLDAGKAVGGKISDVATSVWSGDADSIMENLIGFDVFNMVDIYDNISLRIGNFMYFPSVVITDVSSEHGVKLDAYTHKPIEISVTVTFRTFMTPKAEDLQSMIY